MRTENQKRTVLHGKGGFTLLELIVALAILSLLIGMVSVISYNYLTFSSELVLKQRQEMRNQAFLDWVRRSFGNLPGNAVWQITSTESQSGGGPIMSDMILQEFPLTLDWNDSPIQIKAIRLRTFPEPNGLVRIDLDCYDEEILDMTSQNSDALFNINPIATTTLLDGLRWCEWTVRDPGTDEWSTELARTDSRPYQLQLNFAFGDQIDFTREVFWVPPKMDPQLLVNEMMAGNRSGSSGSRRGGGGNRGNGSNGGGEGRPQGETPGSPGGSPPPSGESGGTRQTTPYPSTSFVTPAAIKPKINLREDERLLVCL